MAGMASSANVLFDELELGPGGEVDLILSADQHEGNWLPIVETATALVIRHFFYDWDTEVASSLSIERIGDSRVKAARPAGGPQSLVARQLIALGQFVVGNLDFLLQFSRPETPNTFSLLSTGRPWARRRRTARLSGRGSSGLTKRSSSRSSRPQGLYWSYSLGNPWWETIDYGSHQSSLNGHQAAADDDGSCGR